mgnify:CR=1 FL=1
MVNVWHSAAAGSRLRAGVEKWRLIRDGKKGILKNSFLFLNTNTQHMEGNDKQAHHIEDDWSLEGEGQAGDPNLNVCESCQ